MNHIPSPPVQFARHSERIAGVLRAARLGEKARDRLRRIVAPAQAVEQRIELFVARVRGHADDARNPPSDRGRVARHNAMFAAGHRDQCGGIVGQRLLAERERAPALDRRAEPHGRVHAHQKCCEKRA